MSEKTSYRLDIRQLPMGKHYYDFLLEDDFSGYRESDADISGKIMAKIDIDKKQSTLNLSMSLQGIIYVPCDRCLEPVALDIDNQQTFALKINANGELLNVADFDLEYEDGILALDTLFLEEILLSIPIQTLHKEGDCDEKILKILNRYSKEGEERYKTETDPRWESLKNISEQLKNN